MTTRRMQKNLTVMFTDISGFTKHTEMISRDDLMKRLETHNALLMPVIAHFEGKIVKTIGDAFLITFESPTNAVQCGLFMQHTLAKFNDGKPEGEQIHIKVSINSGEVTVTDTDVFGDPVNVAAKIEKATNPNEIYFTESVFLAMNKAEVPTSFVKAFRPKGAESQEIKLYKVAMDEGDERYQKIISHTKIDPEKVKTRVRELSDLAEKEVSRYQDTLEALLQNQGKSSRNMILAVLGAVIVLGIVIVIAVTQFGGKTDPAEQLSRDVRASLVARQPEQARTVIEAYLKEYGSDKKSEELLAEVRKFEIDQIVAEANSAIAKGQPENAKAAILKYFGTDTPDGEAAKIVGKVDAYMRARELLEKGEAEAVLKALHDLFGDTSPGDDVRLLRERAQALVAGNKLMASPERYKEPKRLISTIEAGFGGGVSNPAALRILEEGLANELFRRASNDGFDVAAQDLEAYRTRFTNVPSWEWPNISMLTGYFWWTGISGRFEREVYNRHYSERLSKVTEFIKGKPDLLYRWGTMRFILDRKNHQATAGGTESWLEAVKLDRSVIGRHAEIWQFFQATVSDEASVCAKDLRSALEYSLCLSMGHIAAARDLIKLLYYQDMQPLLVKFANVKEPQPKLDRDGKPVLDGDGNPELVKLDDERLNAFIILGEMGDIALIEDRFWIFRELFQQYSLSSYVTQKQLGAVFGVTMTLEQYTEYRRHIDAELKLAREGKGSYGTYPSGRKKVEDILADLKQAQPAHTQAYTE